MNQHREYHYSVTIKTDDEAVLHCLRALSQYAQFTGNKRIPWGGTKKEDWVQYGHRVTFHFSKPEYRTKFMSEVSRLLPRSLWEKIDEKDNDPAVPQS
jgi:hypothetical protein